MKTLSRNTKRLSCGGDLWLEGPRVRLATSMHCLVQRITVIHWVVVQKVTGSNPSQGNYHVHMYHASLSSLCWALNHSKQTAVGVVAVLLLYAKSGTGEQL